MINYSIFPPEMVFEGYDDFDIKYEEINIDSDTSLLVERINDSEVKISQIISTDPQVYLKTDFKPGTILKSSLQLPAKK